jgi:peptide/nickel transport system substrate-binding protein
MPKEGQMTNSGDRGLTFPRRTLLIRAGIATAGAVGASGLLAACSPASVPTTAPAPTSSTPGAVSAQPASASATAGATSQTLAAAADGGTLVVAWGFDPKTLNVAWVWDNPAASIAQMLFDPLVGMSIDGSIQPALAQTWDIAPDGKTYTFHLAPNVKWHDGVPFTSADVKWTLDTIKEVKGPAASQVSWAKIDQVTTPDDNTVVIQLTEPGSTLLEELYGYSSTGGIMPKHLYEGTDVQSSKFNTQPVGTGPFKFVEFVAGDHLTVDANKDYFHGRPHLDRVVLKIVPTTAVGTASLEAAESQYISPSPSFDQIVHLQQQPGIAVDNFFSALTWWIEFNEKPEALTEPLRSPNRIQVRHAIAMSIDKDEINQKILLGFGKPALYPIASSSWALNPDATLPKYDPAGAEQILDQLGYVKDSSGVRFPMEIMIIAGWGGGAAQNMVDVLKEQLRKIGIDVSLKTVDVATSFSDRQAGKWDTFLASTNQGPDPEQLLAQTASTGFANWRGYKNPQVDDLFTRGATITGRDARKQFYADLLKLMANDISQLNIVESPTPYVYRSDFQGWFFQKDTLSYNMNLSKVYWTKANT